MILADVNLLVYAFDADSPHHTPYASWLEATLTSGEEFALLDAVLSGFVRIVTHPKIMPRPAPTNLALDFVDTLIDAPGARWLHGSPELWAAFRTLEAGDRAIRGNLVPDAYIAAAALAHGARVATADRGFARFPGVRCFDPAA